MHLSDAGWQASVRLRRLRSLLSASVVEAKLHRLERALKTNFDPNQPRVPAGNPDGGQWTDGGGGQTSDGRVAQVSRGSGRRRGSDAEATPAQLIRRDVAEAQARAAIRRVNEIDPAWKPQASLTRPNSVEGQTAKAEAALVEAEARLRELATQPPENLMDAYRRQQGLDLFGEPIWSRERYTVALCKADGKPFVGVNSEAPTYTISDGFEAGRLRDVLVKSYQELMNTDRVDSPTMLFFMLKRHACCELREQTTVRSKDKLSRFMSIARCVLVAIRSFPT